MDAALHHELQPFLVEHASSLFGLRVELAKIKNR
jgi:hypothetical protein